MENTIKIKFYEKKDFYGEYAMTERERQAFLESLNRCVRKLTESSLTEGDITRECFYQICGCSRKTFNLAPHDYFITTLINILRAVCAVHGRDIDVEGEFLKFITERFLPSSDD